MSYLDFPRVHFSGRFAAGPSTINNTPDNYEPGQQNLKLLWNPNGNAYIQLQDCKVTRALTGMGGADDSTLEGSPVASTDNWGGSGVPAKLVDLDPEQQMVSMFFGLQLKIGEGDNYVVADMTAVWFQNYFGTSATYQSVLTPVEWGSKLTGVVEQWKECSSELLSIRFAAGPVLGGPVPPTKPDGSTPLICQIVGTIGPGDPAEPISFVPARLLRPTTNPARNRGRYNFAPAKVTLDGDGNPVRLTVDLGSSAPRNSETLTVSVEKPKDPPFDLGTLEFSQQALLSTALIADFDLGHLTGAEAHSLLNGPIVVKDGSENQVFAESGNGIYVDAYPYVFRMEADSTAEVSFWATRFGAPADVSIVISDETASKLGPNSPQVGKVGPNGTKVTFDTPVQAVGGRATATIHGGDPDGFREFIDGQVYALAFQADPPATDSDPVAFLSLLVHDGFEQAPTWDNIQPIMQQYAVLYPVMKNMGIDLGDPASLQANKSALLRVFGLPIDNPGYMPVVRDLSDAKRNAIVAWLNSLPDA